MATPAAVHAALIAQLEAASNRLTAHHASSATSIHATRKSVKRARAVLRLLRPWIGALRYRRMNVALRDASASLRDVRDARVKVQTLDDLAASLPKAAAPALRALRRQLERSRRTGRRHWLHESDGPRPAARALHRATVSAQHWRVPSGGAEGAVTAFLHTYRKGHAAFIAARRSPTDLRLHECRKQANYLRHQLTLLRKLNPEYLDRLPGLVQQFVRDLGADHDLAVLAQDLGRRRGATGADIDGYRTLTRHIIARRRRLQKRSLATGQIFYRHTPVQLKRHLGEHPKS